MLNTLRLRKLAPVVSYSKIKNGPIASKSRDYLETKYRTNQRPSYGILKKRFAILMTIDSYHIEDFDALHRVLNDADLNYKNKF